MSHAHHFLGRLDRVTRQQTEFALGLYRDHEAVRYVLEQVNLPASAERVALAIDDPREGPFVIVTRDGRFITCLGTGMHHDHPVVPRPQLDALIAKVADKRARRELAQRELRPEEDEDDIFQRVVKRGSRLAREDFVAVSAFEPMLAGAADADAMRHWAASGVLAAIDRVAEYERAALDLGRRLCAASGEHLAEGHPLRFASPDDVPEALASTAVLAVDMNTWDAKLRSWMFVGLTVAARAAAEDFYLPREVMRAWLGEWEPAEALERVTRLSREAVKKEPVRVAATPGRNEPCTCGSGKKWKRCHGSGVAA